MRKIHRVFRRIQKKLHKLLVPTGGGQDSNVGTSSEGTGTSSEGTGTSSEVKVISVAITGENKVKVGETITLSANVTNSTQGVTWSSESTAVATIGADTGVVTGVAAGTTKIIATSKEDTSKKAEVTITVEESKPVKPADAVDLVFAEQNADGNPTPEHQLQDDKMTYWNDQTWGESVVTVNYAYSYEDVYYISYSTTGKNIWGANFQLFYKNTQLDYTKKWAVSFKLESNVAGKITVNGIVKDIVKGNNTISATVIHRDGNYADLVIATGTNDGNGNITQIDAADFTLSELKWEESKELTAPAFSISKDNKITITEVTGAAKYQIKLTDADNQPAGEVMDVVNGQTLDLSSLADGAYKVFIMAVGDGVVSFDSPWSINYAIVNKGTILMQAPAEEATIAFGEEANQPLNKYYYWNDQNWCKSNIAVSKAVVQGQDATFTFSTISEEGEGCTFAFQVFYKNTSLEAQKRYKLSFTLNSTFAGQIKLFKDAEEVQDIIVGDNTIEYEYTEVLNKASLHIIVPSSLQGTLVVKNPIWTPVEA